MSNPTVEETAGISFIGSLMIAVGVYVFSLFYTFDKALNVAGFVFVWSLIVSFVGMNLRRVFS